MNDLFRGHHVPESSRGHQQKLVLVCYGHLADHWLGCQPVLVANVISETSRHGDSWVVLTPAVDSRSVLHEQPRHKIVEAVNLFLGLFLFAFVACVRVGPADFTSVLVNTCLFTGILGQVQVLCDQKIGVRNIVLKRLGEVSAETR